MSVEDYNSARNFSSPTTGVGGEPTKPDLGAKRIDFIDITEKLREHGDQPLVMLTSSFLQAKDNLGRFDDYALVLRRCVDREGVEISTTLEIRSEILRKTLKECLADYASLTLEAIPILIRKPYDALFHYRKELRGYATADERTAEEKPHMKLLLDFMNRNIAASERAYEQLVPQNLITFDLLWALFRVDEIIIQTTDHYTQAYRVKSSKTYLLNNEIVFEISAWNWGYNGSRFGPSPDVIIIEHFQGQRKVTDLHVYPLYILSPKSQQDFKNDFIQRGRQWKSLGEVTYGEYEGPMWVNPPDEKVERMSDLILNQISGRIVLDSKSFQQNNYVLATRLIGSNGIIRPKIQPTDSYMEAYYMRKTMERLIEMESEFENGRTGSLSRETTHANTPSYHMTDDQALLCPARASGFALGAKNWALFLVDGVHEVKWRDGAFEKLQLESTSKSTIQALVQTHNPTDQFDDFIKDKGKGLILLLYGPPGCGKTLTAESVAEFTHRPLYHIGAAELGTDVDAAEKGLKRVFELAKDWNAILLLDEADVFLSKRTRDDMVRNAFVAVFLRLLEYYQGILFLTTNRLEEFDAAFESRIHLSIEYFPLTSDQRSNVWRNLLSAIPECQTWDSGVYERIGTELQLNGRSIKNLIRTSLAIARQNGNLLTEEHLRIIYRLNYKCSSNWGKAENEGKRNADDNERSRSG